MSESDPLRVRGITKSYVEGVPVLDGVDITVTAGHVLALVGANGSGKSTLVKVLSGYHAADAGALEIRGAAVGSVTPEMLRASGIRFVHQESTIVPGLTVLENLAVGGYETRSGRIRWRHEEQRVRELLGEWDLDVSPHDDAGRLSAAAVAKLGLLKAIRMRPGDEPVHAVVLDEPTAALGPDDAAELLGWLRSAARRSGVGVLFISHRIEEILGFADRVAVLRGGRVVADLPTTHLSPDELVAQIVGRSLESYYPERDVLLGDPRLVVDGASGGAVQELGFTVRAGETIGITGAPGSGFEDVPLLLVDPAKATAGTLAVDGRSENLAAASIARRRALGIALVPDERKRRALAGELSVRENIALPRLRSFRRGLLHGMRHERRDADQLVERFGVSPRSSQPAANRLSGGNQQKVVLAKWLSTAPRVLIVHEPTQAVDVGAKSEIFQVLADTARSGVAVVIVSVEHEDLARLCDRVLVLRGGRMHAELTGAALTAETIGSAAFGASVPA
ncbi:MAG: sugar ABC transporter ATP-binding protein [Actinobacteria bacterium]|nr:sugar ABC transporter ATP-binding protein [Actinomycetota bacterium]